MCADRKVSGDQPAGGAARQPNSRVGIKVDGGSWITGLGVHDRYVIVKLCEGCEAGYQPTSSYAT